MKPRILQICPHDSPPFGELCQAFTQAAEMAGCEATTVILGGPTNAPLHENIYLDLTNVRGARSTLCKRLNSDADWDLVICHRYQAYRAALGLHVDRIKIVVVAHEYGILKSLSRRLHRLFLASRVRFGAVSPSVSRELAAITGFGLVLPNVLDLEACQAARLERDQARKHLGLPELGVSAQVFTVGVVGRLHYKKRPQLAVQAFQHFRRARPDAQLVFVGTGDAKQEEQLTQDGALVLGNIPNARSAFRAFDVLLHTGDVESFGMVILEAMAAGVPVVVGAGGGPEYVLGPLGHYACEDTPQAYAEALARAAVVDLERYREQSQQRAQRMFSLTALSRSLETLVDFVEHPETDPYIPPP